jgi:hypothetical protein
VLDLSQRLSGASASAEEQLAWIGRRMDAMRRAWPAALPMTPPTSTPHTHSEAAMPQAHPKYARRGTA